MSRTAKVVQFVTGLVLGACVTYMWWRYGWVAGVLSVAVTGLSATTVLAAMWG